MNELIKVTTNENDEQLVSARDLHKGLEVKTRFSQWVTQNFRESIDFTSVVATTVVNNGALRELQDYALSVEMAKHIAMMTGTPKGYEVRDYFITIEKAWNNPDMVVKRAMQIQDKKIERLTLANAELQPKALFADAVRGSKNSCLITELATILKQNNVNIGQNRLFDWLRDNGYLCREGRRKNHPTQRSLDLGIMSVREHVRTDSEGNLKTSFTPLITGKGQQYFVNKFLKLEIGG